MKTLKRTIWLAMALGALSALGAIFTGHLHVGLGIVLAVATGCFSLFTIGILCSGVSGGEHPQKGRQLAFLWLLVKLPVLAGLIMLAGRLGPDAERSFILTIGLVYSLLLCLAWLEIRMPERVRPSDRVTELAEQDDTEH